jgi:TolB-like protein
MQAFLRELKRRNVVRVAGIYLGAGWLLAQVAGLLGEWFHWPERSLQIFFIALGLAFPLALLTAWFFEITAQGIKLTRNVELSESIRPATGRKLDRILIGVLGALVLVLLVDRLFLVGAGNVPAAAAAAAGAQRTVAARIAVLPFVNISSDPEEDTFVDGLTVEVLNSLARVDDLEVTGRTSSFYYKGRNEDARVIGTTLGVAHIVEGTARKSGDQVRIDVQLTDTTSGTNVWARSYDRPIQDFIAVQEDIARSVSEVLQVSLGVGELGRQPGMTRNLEAYEAYLSGRQAAALDAELLARSLDHLERAVALDRSFAEAWIELENVYSFAATIGLPGETPQAWAAKADTAIGHVVELLPGSPAALGLQADRNLNRFDWKTAHRQFEEIGRDARYRVGKALFLMSVGRVNEAIPTLERSALADPLNAFLAFLLVYAHAANGDVQAAMVEAERGKRIGGFGLELQAAAAWTALATKDGELIDRQLEEIRANGDPTELNAVMARLRDSPDEALLELRRRAELGNSLEAYTIAYWRAYFGDNVGALAAFRVALGDRTTTRRTGVFFIWHPLFADARKLDVFKDLVREIGLVDYWREFGWADFCRPVAGTDEFECS